MTTALGFSEADIKDPIKMASVVSHGIPADLATNLASRLGISQDDLCDLIFIPKRTLHRRLENTEVLKQDESERVLRALGLLLRAIEVFENEERAARWFSSHPKALGGKTPLEFMRTEPGARFVENLLGRIENGVFS
jgi:putative toxin-antitoxin system antitoxin component (TIGR02293 family)